MKSYMYKFTDKYYLKEVFGNKHDNDGVGDFD